MAKDPGHPREWVRAVLLPLAGCGLIALWIAAADRGRAGRGDEPTLHELIRKGDTAAALGALERGADVNCPESGSGFTPLMCAARHRRPDVARALLGRGADVNAMTPGFGSPLANAAAAGGDEMVRLLLEHGADPNRCDPDGHSPLMCAAAAGDERAVRTLLRSGADVNARDVRGNTPLTVAAAQRHRGVMRALVAAGADVHARTRDGMTADMMLREAQGRVFAPAARPAPAGAFTAAGESRPSPPVEIDEWRCRT